MVHGQADLDESLRVFRWNELIMTTLGLWPASLSNFRFFLNFSYFSYQMILEYLDLFLFVDNLEHVLLNLTENMAFTPIFIRVLMLRLYNRELRELISEANKDFDAKNYTDKEIKTFIAYHAKSRSFMKLLINEHCAHCHILLCEANFRTYERAVNAYARHIYICKWYNMSTSNAKVIILCMMARSQKPLQLTAGKFSWFRLTTLTDTIKASMGYLSVLRAVLKEKFKESLTRL